MIDYGVLETDGNGRLTGFREKPRSRYEVSMGVYMLRRACARLHSARPAVRLRPPDARSHRRLRSGSRVRRFDGYWLDIGRPDDYARAIDEFDAMRSRFLDG